MRKNCFRKGVLIIFIQKKGLLVVFAPDDSVYRVDLRPVYSL